LAAGGDGEAGGGAVDRHRHRVGGTGRVHGDDVVAGISGRAQGGGGAGDHQVVAHQAGGERADGDRFPGRPHRIAVIGDDDGERVAGRPLVLGGRPRQGAAGGRPGGRGDLGGGDAGPGRGVDQAEGEDLPGVLVGGGHADAERGGFHHAERAW